MICFLVFWFLGLSCSFGSPTESSTEVLTGVVQRFLGEPADIKDFPYQLGVDFIDEDDYNQFCGAAILTPRIAITAAFCYSDYSRTFSCVRAGSAIRHEGGQCHPVIKYVMHPKFIIENPDNDVALLKVEKPFVYSESVKPIALATETPKEGTPAITTGWGENRRPKKHQMEKLTVFILNRSECQQSYGKVFAKTMLCAGYVPGYKDACIGEPGGPLMAENKLVGIVHYRGTCIRPGDPGSYIDVSQYHKWITDTIVRLNGTQKSY